MLEVQKKVLEGVSFSKELFKKELIKSHAWLNHKELEDLQTWVIKNYRSIHPEIINEVFNNEYLAAV